MKKIDITISVQEYDKTEELNPEDRSLLERAKNAIGSAYAPYSAYRVGAAVLLENGEIITGNNQENVAYPSGLCAERVALFYAASQFPDVPVKAIAITAKANGFVIETPVTPCGSCRQVMAETENRFKNKMKLVMMGEKGKVQVIDGVENILPLMFHAEKLKK
ncbi:MAG: cytidine deaminase [Bacteroidetes bacterium]|nr:cytidine deaminase [Bacteroidota bacterium]MBL7104037.1 cytidine deaminase [Bacteroidales bacterium]